MYIVRLEPALLSLGALLIGACGSHPETGEARAVAENGCAEMHVSDYRDFSRVPLSCRGAVFSAQTPMAKSAIWQAQLSHFRERRRVLTVEQQAVLQRAQGLFTPGFFAVSQHSAEWSTLVDAPLRSLSRQATEAFGFDEARALLAVLGPADPASIKVHFSPSSGHQ